MGDDLTMILLMSQLAASPTQIRTHMLAKVHERGVNKSICPSEVAKAVDPENWRGRMTAVRRVAHELIVEGKIQVTQKGVPVDMNTARGPIRIRLIKA